MFNFIGEMGLKLQGIWITSTYINE